MPEGEPKGINYMTHAEVEARLAELQAAFGGKEGFDGLYREGLGHWTSGRRDTPAAALYVEIDQLDRRTFETRDQQSLAPTIGGLSIAGGS